MFTEESIIDFLSQRTLALLGVSRTNPNKWGNIAYHNLQEKGYQVFIVHPSGEMIEGVQSYRSLAELPQAVGGVVIVVPPDQTELVVQEAYAQGIMRIWMQPGAEAQSAIDYCEQHGMNVIHDVCIMVQSR